MTSQSVYLDHSATTPVDPRVVSEMLPYLHEKFANPSAAYASAREVRKAIENGRLLQELINEAGVRYVSALKNEEPSTSRK